MLVFIDESGDPGKTPGPSCSRFFTVTLVIFHDYDEAEKTEKCIAQLRKELRVAEQFEFHFSKLKHEWRERFLKAVSRYKWLYVSVVINKAELYGPGFAVPDSFYKYTCGRAFELVQPQLRNAIVVIDSSGNRGFREELKAYLRKRLTTPHATGEPPIKKLKMEESHRNNLLQLADMVCGAVSRDINHPDEKHRFRKLIAHNQTALHFWPK
jgi:hypothetical protein